MTKSYINKIVPAVCLILTILAAPAFSMSSANFQVPSGALVNAGGAGSSSNFRLDGSLGQDTAGNLSSTSFSLAGGLENILVDRFPSTTTASPGGGQYFSNQYVQLACGSGCGTIYYTMDGSTPNGSSFVYNGPIVITTTTTLRFFSVNNIGLTETPKSATYSIVFPPSNDSWSNAKMISNSGYTDSVDTQFATASPDEPDACPGNHNYSVWYKYTAPASGKVLIDTRNSTYDTVLSAWTRSGSVWTAVACNDDYYGPQSYLMFNAAAGTTYYVMVSSGGAGFGTAQINFVVAASDITAPATTATPAGGAYSAAQSVTLSANEQATIFYTVYGDQPKASMSVYTGPILVNRDMTLKYFAVDAAGNVEAVKTAVYLVQAKAKIGNSPASVTNSSWAYMAVTGANLTSYKYQLDSGPWSAEKTMAARIILSGLGSGSHAVSVLGRDSSGNWQTDPSIASWTIDSSAPTTVVAASGGDNDIYLKSDGTLWSMSAHAAINSDHDWISVRSGLNYTIALKSDGSLWSWGQNYYGQLGLGDITARAIPVQVGTDKDWAYITAGNNGPAALKSDGSLWSWGFNLWGQLGLGDTANRNAPALVGNDHHWTSVSAGGSFTAALKDDGTIWAWGLGAYGVLGTDRTNRTSPAQVGSDEDWANVSAGGYHVAALKADGTLWTWGDSTYGQLGNGITNQSLSSPIRIGADNTWVFVSAGGMNTKAVKADGTLWGWGYNIDGQWRQATSPVQAVSGNTWASVAAGIETAAGMKSDGTLWVWGDGWTYNSLHQVDFTPPTTMASPAGGSFPVSVISVSLSCSDDQSGCGTIYYTLDDTVPTTSSSVYSGPIDIAATRTLKFFSVDAAGNSEAVKSEVYAPETARTVTPVAGTHGAISPSTPQTVAYNGQATFTVTPDPWYQLLSVSGCGAAPIGDGTQYQTSGVTADCTITAAFTSTEPVLALTANPPSVTNSADANFSFSFSQTGSTFQCNIDNNGYAPCSSPVSYSSLVNGSHTFTVFAVDAGGHACPAPTTYTWMVDVNPPTGSVLINAGVLSTNTTSVVLNLSARDGETSVAQMILSNDNIVWSSPLSYTSTTTWTLALGNSLRAPVTITNYLPGYQTKINIAYRPGMNQDFSDIRFTDAVANQQLPYWIESKVDGVSALVWFKTGSNNAIYLTYGDPSAVSACSASDTFIADSIYAEEGSCADYWVCQYYAMGDHYGANTIRSYPANLMTGYKNSIYWGAVGDGTMPNTDVENGFYSRFRYLIIPDVTGTWNFAVNSSQGSELIVNPGDASNPSGETVIAAWYGDHYWCGDNCTSYAGPLAMTSGQGLWLDYIQSDYSRPEAAVVYFQKPAGDWTLMDTANLPGQVFARTYADIEPTTALGAEEPVPQMLTVYAKFSDVVGNWSGAYSAGIAYDPSIVAGSAPSILNATTTNPGAAYKAGAQINLSLVFDRLASSAGLQIHLNSGAIVNTGPLSNVTSWSGIYDVSVGQNASGLNVDSVSGILCDNQSDCVSNLTIAAGQNISDMVTIVIDTTPPALTMNPVATPTNSNVQTVTGTLEAGASLQITTNTAAVAGVVSINGTAWSCDISNLQQGSNTIAATAADAVGNAITTNGSIALFRETGTILGSSANPLISGAPVTFTATVIGGGNPTGSVTFMDGVATLGTGTLSNGLATYAASVLSEGSHSITAVYSGDSLNTPSTSFALPQSVISTDGFIAVTAGAWHSAAVKTDGSVVAWGADNYGQINVPLSASSGVASLAAGDSSTLALKEDGSVIGWGDNSYGQISIPVSADSGVIVVTARGFHGAALKNDDSVVAWGSYRWGQGMESPPALIGVIALAAGANNTAALLKNGSVTAWGDNYYGESTVPEAASSNVVAVAAGDNHMLALRGDGSVVAWGDNSFGQIQVPDAAGSGVIAIAAGGRHSVALKNDGSVVAWGDNWFGQLSIPAPASSGVIAISAGMYHTVALKSDGTLVAWGDNSYGQSTAPVLPTRPGAPTNVTASAGNAEVTVTFTAPVSNGSSITGYTVTSFPDNISASGTASPISVTGLTNGKAYTFTVEAVNAVGTGPASTPSNSATPGTTRPLAPRIGAAIAGNAQAVVSFSAPSADGGSPITGYTVLSHPTGGTDSNAGTTAASHTVTGLTNGTAYTFTVIATNVLGTSDPSAASNTITPDGISPVVSNIQPSGQMASAIFAITSSFSDSNTGINTSTVVVTLDGAAVTGCAATTLGVVCPPLSGLSQGSHAINISVNDQAGNPGTGAGSFQFFSSANAPVVLAASLTNNRRPSWTWTPGGGGNNTFRYQLDSSGWTTTTATSFSPSFDLGDGNHAVYVQEQNAAGYWSAWGYKTVIVDTVGPTLPNVSGVTPTNTNRPTWTWTSGGGGGNGTYQYQLDSGSWTTTSAQSYKPASGLSEGSHTLYVQERDAIGNWSDSGYKTIVIDTIGPVLNLSTLSNDAVTNNNVLNITGTAADASGVNTVSITLNNSPTETITENFNTAALLQLGANTLVIAATDALGNQTAETRTITFDTSVPKLTVTEPSDNSTFKGNVIDVRGPIGAGESVAVKVNDGAPQAALTSEQTYTATITLASGMNTIEIIATDASHRTNSIKRTVAYDNQGATLSITQPNEDIVVNQNSMVIRGTVADAPEGVMITVEADGQVYTPTLTSGVFEQTVIFGTEGAYPVIVTIKDIGGNTISRVQRNIIYKLLPVVTLTSDKTSPQILSGAGTITFTAHASEGTGNYEYFFWLKTGGVWNKVQTYSPTNTWIWNTTGATAGTYTVQVYVRNVGSSASYEAVKNLSYVLSNTPATAATLTADSPSPQIIGTTITFTAGGVGGTGNYNYKFWLKTAGTWTTVQGYSATNTWTWNTTGATAGTYTVQVYVKNNGSSAAYEALKSFGYVLASPPAGSATLIADAASPQTAGATVTFTGGGIGGSGSYEYRFWLKAAGVWTTVQAYSTDNTWTWDTTGLAPGTYRVQAYVRNVGSSAKYDTLIGKDYVIQ